MSTAPHASRPSLPPLEVLLPHRAPMLLLDSIERVSEDGRAIVCLVNPRAEGPFVEGGRVPALLALEYFAQAAAAVFAVRAAQGPGREFRIGVLLGARELVMDVDFLPVGEPVRVHAQEVWSDEWCAQFRCELTGPGGASLARGSINVQHGAPQ